MSAKWRYRDGRDGEYAEHERGDYLVTVQDMDGDGTQWNVWLKSELAAARKRRENGDQYAHANAVAHGSIFCHDDFQVGKRLAIAALEEILKTLAVVSKTL